MGLLHFLQQPPECSNSPHDPPHTPETTPPRPPSSPPIATYPDLSPFIATYPHPSPPPATLDEHGKPYHKRPPHIYIIASQPANVKIPPQSRPPVSAHRPERPASTQEMNARFRQAFSDHTSLQHGSMPQPTRRSQTPWQAARTPTVPPFWLPTARPSAPPLSATWLCRQAWPSEAAMRGDESARLHQTARPSAAPRRASLGDKPSHIAGTDETKARPASPPTKIAVIATHPQLPRSIAIHRHIPHFILTTTRRREPANTLT